MPITNLSTSRTALLALLGAVTLGTSAAAQDVVLNNQAAVNSFSATTVAGNLTISGPDITDLSPLSSLVSVGGSLIVASNPALPDLDGLSGLASLGGALEIVSNDALMNLDGLGGLSSVSGYLAVVGQAALTNLDGLGGLASVSGFLFVANNAVLPNVNGLGNLTTVGSDLYIASNPALLSLNGLGGLVSVGGFMFVANNVALDGYCGLYRLFQNGGPSGTVAISGNALNPTGSQILSAGPCRPGTLGLLMPSNCAGGRVLTLTGDPSIGSTITATMTGDVGVPFVTWGFGPTTQPFSPSCSCELVTVEAQWQFGDMASLTIPFRPAFMGVPFFAQGADVGPASGATCVLYTTWAFTDIHVATIRVQ